MHLRKYATLTVAGTAGSDLIRFSLRVAGAATYATGADWTPAAGDVKVSLDGGAEANVTTLPTYVNGSWALSLSAAELTAKVVRLRISDAAVDDWDDTVESFGNAAATWPDAYNTALIDGLPTAVENADALFARPLPASPVAGSAGEAFKAAAAQGIGDMDIDGNTLTLKDPAGATLAQFTLSPAGGPFTARVRQ